jgi:hypothetical protein
MSTLGLMLSISIVFNCYISGDCSYSSLALWRLVLLLRERLLEYLRILKLFCADPSSLLEVEDMIGFNVSLYRDISD